MEAFTREALAIEIDQGIKGEQVVVVMARISSVRGAPNPSKLTGLSRRCHVGFTRPLLSSVERIDQPFTNGIKALSDGSWYGDDMPGYYEIRVEAHRSFMFAKLSGRFDVDAFDAFREARVAAHRDLRHDPCGHITMIDLPGFEEQTNYIADRFQVLLQDPSMRARLLAIVVDETPAAFQIRHAASQRRAHYFTSTDEAEQWIAAAISMGA